MPPPPRLHRRLLFAWVMPARPGGHGLQWYASNGSVVEAFGFALDLLW